MLIGCFINHFLKYKYADDNILELHMFKELLSLFLGINLPFLFFTNKDSPKKSLDIFFIFDNTSIVGLISIDEPSINSIEL